MKLIFAILVLLSFAAVAAEDAIPFNKTGLLHDPNWAYKKGETWYLPPDRVEIPDNFDLRDFMPAGVPDIRQQQCGDCWAWATHHGVELVRAIYDKKVFDHSVQTILSCSKHGSCSGGYMTTPLWVVNRGVPYEPQFTYTGQNTSCKFSNDEMTKGWDGKLLAAPNVGSSLRYSRYWKMNGGYREGTKVTEMMKAAVLWKSPLVVTVYAYNAGNSTVTSCSSINSGGNHMVDVVGWRMENGKRVAHVWNSWGKSHGDGATTTKGVNTPGVSSIVWECGDGKLNRGLGTSARFYQYKPPCDAPVAPKLQAKYVVSKGSKIKLGDDPISKDHTCKWTPSKGVQDPNACRTWISPEVSTEYHVEVKSKDCGTASAQTLIAVVDINGNRESDDVLTPFGTIKWTWDDEEK